MIVTKPIDLILLQTELAAASIVVDALGLSGVTPSPANPAQLFTYDESGNPLELPPGAAPVVDAHVAPPRVTEFAGSTEVHAIVRTTDDQPLVVFSFPCELKHRYTANLTIDGVDAVSFVSKYMEGRFAWKRVAGNAVMVGGSGIVVVAQLQDAAAASWAPNALPVGTAIEFSVKGAVGRTIDWLLVGEVRRFAPEGLTEA